MASRFVDPENGEKEYIGYLTLEFDSQDYLISEFDFTFRKIYDTTSEFYVNQYNSQYDSIVSADYANGLTPYGIATVEEGQENQFVIGFSHNVDLPTFSEEGGGYSVSYSTNEQEAMMNQFGTSDFGDSMDSYISSMASSIYSKMNISTNQDFVFNKSKKDMIEYKNLSKFDVEQKVQSSNQMVSNSSAGTSNIVGGY